MNKYKHFSIYFSLLLILFVFVNLIVYNFYTKELLVIDKKVTRGDLARLSYDTSLSIPKINKYTLKELHYELDKFNKNNIDLITIGDSFSTGNSGGLNKYYQDYIIKYSNLRILNIPQLQNTNNYIETVILLTNSGILEKLKVKYILIESVQRNVVKRLLSVNDYTLNTDKSLQNLSKEIPVKKSSLDNIGFINTGNFKFLFYNLMYNFSNKAFFSKVYKTKLVDDFFSHEKSKSLLFYNKDIKNIKYSTIDNLKVVNDNLNKLSLFLKRKDIKLIFMPAVNKYTLYEKYILENKLAKDNFFEIFNNLDKNYYFVDTNKILSKELDNKVKDIFYIDDTHWSHIASEVISKEIANELKGLK